MWRAKATFWCWTLLITTCLSFMTQYSPNERLNWIQFWQQCKTARIKCNWVHRQYFQCSAASSVWSIFITLHNGLDVANDFQNIFKIQSLTWNTTTDRLCAEHIIHDGLLLYIQIDGEIWWAFQCMQCHFESYMYMGKCHFLVVYATW